MSSFFDGQNVTDTVTHIALYIYRLTGLTKGPWGRQTFVSIRVPSSGFIILYFESIAKIYFYLYRLNLMLKKGLSTWNMYD